MNFIEHTEGQLLKEKQFNDTSIKTIFDDYDIKKQRKSNLI